MAKEVFAVKNPQGDVYYPSISDDEKMSQLVAVNRFLDKWDDLVAAGWRSVRLILTDAVPA